MKEGYKESNLDYFSKKAEEIGISREEYKALTRSTRFGMTLMPEVSKSCLVTL